MSVLRFVVKLLVVAGALNWGLVGFFNYNLVADIFGGELTTGARVVFSLVGIAGLLFLWCWCKKCCHSSCSSCPCSKGSCGSCNCGPNCPRCSCGRNKHEQ